jgi:phosphoadenosine phosphosulfate reductase
MPVTSAEIEEAARRLAGAAPAEIVAWAVGRFGRRLAIASSFSIEDCVVIDLALKAAAAKGARGDVRVFALDTGRLPDETYQTAERVRAIQSYAKPYVDEFEERGLDRLVVAD